MPTIHEIKNPIQVHTEHGEGLCIAWIDYGINVNTVWMVRLRGGHIKHYDSSDVRMYGNPMISNNGYDLDLPTNWTK